jgi:glutathione reductase (NADPH)
MENYDVFIFGTGTAGKLVAKRCAAAGLKTAIIDNREYGGTCSQRGCDPKKLMMASSEAFEFANNMQGDGITGTVAVDFKAALNFAGRYTQNIPDNTEQALKDAGVSCYHGNAHFIDTHTIELVDQKISAKHFVIATGLKPMELNIPGASHMLTSDDFFKLNELPEKAVFIGAGYVGMEFSHMLARAGCKVTIIDMGDRILSPFEEFTSALVYEQSLKLGITFIMNAQAASVEENEERFTLHYGLQDGSSHQITANVIFNTAGRVPSTDSLKLENAGVVTDSNGIVVNNKMQSTTQSHIYACGDVSSHALPLTPLSSIEASVVASNLLGKPREIKIPAIPSIVFTIPQCATIGLTEEDAREKKLDFEIIQEDASGWFNTKRINADAYRWKLILDKKTDLILGAHIASHEAGEQINMIAIAMNAQMTFTHFKRTIFTYPSWGNDFKSYE